MAAGDLMPGPTPSPGSTRALPKQLRRCRRVVAATLRLPEFLLAAAGLVQRLAEVGVSTDVLVAASADEATDDAAAAGLGELRVDDLARHRLSLPTPFGMDRENDLVAALSELVGFDPEPGVYLLVPDVEAYAEPSRATLAAAVTRVADVYRLPMVRFAATPDEASVELDLGSDEWTRKCAGLAACATQVTPLSGRKEFFAVSLPRRPF